jgi:putative transposase
MGIQKLRPKYSGKALRVLKLSRSSFHYRSLKDDSTVMRELERLTESHPREGFWKYYYRLRNRGKIINHKLILNRLKKAAMYRWNKNI